MKLILKIIFKLNVLILINLKTNLLKLFVKLLLLKRIYLILIFMKEFIFHKINIKINIKFLNKKYLINNLLEILILWIEIEILSQENKHNLNKFKIIKIACKNQIYQ